MSYLQFLLIFLVAPTALLLALNGHERLRDTLVVIAILVVVTLLFGVPLEFALVHTGVWGETGRGIAGIAFEDVAFFVLLAAFTGTLTMLVLRRRWWSR